MENSLTTTSANPSSSNSSVNILTNVKRNVQEVEVANSSLISPLDIVNNVPLLRLLSTTNTSSSMHFSSIASKIDEGCRRILVQGELAQNSFLTCNLQQQPPPHANPRLTGSIFAPPSKETTSNKHSYSGIPLLPSSLPSLLQSYLEMQREKVLSSLDPASKEARSLRLYQRQEEMRQKVYTSIHLSSCQPCSPEQCNDIALRLEKSLFDLGREQQKKTKRGVISSSGNHSHHHSSSSSSSSSYQSSFTKGVSSSNSTTSQALRQARMEEKKKVDERRERQRRERMAWQNELSKVTTKLRELQQGFWRTPTQKRLRLTRSVLQCHSNWEREASRKLDKMAKERIRALKEDDEEGYLALLDEEKDGRLTYLLRQTDEFLEGLSIKLSIQQRLSSTSDSIDVSNVETTTTTTTTTTNTTSKDDEQTLIGKEGLQGAHRIKETVKEQPRMMTGGKLKEYQIKGLQWMVSLHNNNLNGILADEMGLGKTVQTIALISYLLESKGLKGPYLVLVPLSTMTNWVNELKRWAPSLVTLEWRGTPTQRKSLIPTLKLSAFNVLLTTYEYIIRDKKYLSKISWLYLVVDEGHRMKNSASKLSLIISSHYRSRYRLLLTGTPLQNNLPELWSLLNFLLPTIFNSVKSFEDWFNAPFAKYTDSSSSSSAATAAAAANSLQISEEEALLIIKRLHKLLRPFLLRRLKKDVEKELPDKREEIVQCPMSHLQRQLYEMIKREGRNEIIGGGGGAFEGRKSNTPLGITKLNNTIMQLRKVCNHPFIFEDVEKNLSLTSSLTSNLVRSCGKFDLLNRMLPKLILTGHRILIFFQMTQIMTIVEDFLLSIGIRYLRLDGSTKADERTELLGSFNSPSSPFPIFLLSTRAGGLGLNLQVADTVIIFDSDWNPHQDLQAQDRAHRIGQTKEVRIYRMVTKNSIEEYIVKRAQEKLNLDGKVIQAGRFDHKSTAEERDEMLKALLAQDSLAGEFSSGGTTSPLPTTLNEEEDDDLNNSEEEGDENSNTNIGNTMMAEEEEDDEFLNEILARSEEEMAIFREYDLERRRERWNNATSLNPLPRLISLEEVPSIYKAMPENNSLNSHSNDLPMERSARLTKKIYNEDGDNDIEKDWLMVDDDADADADDGINNLPTTTPSLSPTNKKVKLTLKIQRPKLDLTRDSLIEGLKSLKKGKTASLFLQKPSPILYPDYYQIVKNPISLEEIGAKEYLSKSSLLDDLYLMFDNAYLYNSPTSQVCRDVESMRNWVLETYKPIN